MDIDETTDMSDPRQIVQEVIQTNLANPQKHKAYVAGLSDRIVVAMENAGMLHQNECRRDASPATVHSSPELEAAISSALSSLGTLASMLNAHGPSRYERS